MRQAALIFLASTLAAAASMTNWPAAQYLMVDQHGHITPEGYAAGLDEIARAEAQAAAAQAAARAVADAAASASNVVDDIVSVLTGSIGFGYVIGHTVSIGGVVQVSTNASASIVACELGAAGATNIAGVAHTGHYIWHVYTEQMNAMPAIKYKRTLESTNAWEFADYQSTAEFSNHTVGGATYDTVYRSTVPAIDLRPRLLHGLCEIKGGQASGGVFTVHRGFAIGGKEGFM